MADFSNIIQEINDDINTNGVGAITGAKLNEVLCDMIAAVNAEKQDPLTIDAIPTENSTNPVQSGGVFTALANLIPDGCLYGGVIRPSSYPLNDKRFFYITDTPGTYTHFNNLEIANNTINVIYWVEDGEFWNMEYFGISEEGVDKLVSDRFKVLYGDLGFDVFLSSQSYSVGDYVTNFEIGGLYRFTSNHSGAWDDNDVEEVTLIDYIDELLSGKQDTISDLSTIRSGAAAGATAYQKPNGGIPASDLATAVQTSLGKADTALQSYTETDPVFSASPAAGITSGDISDWDAKADPIPVVDASTIPASMEPNKLYKYGTLSGDTTFPALNMPTDLTVAHVYCWTFATPATAPTITWPSGITSWAGGSAPTINASKSYEVSVMDGFATIIEN